MINVVVLVGRLTSDPQLRYTTGNEPTAVCRFSVAVDDGFGDRKRTNFIPITAFGKVAESCERFLSKGKQVAVTGKIQTGSYEKDGRKVYTTDVIANMVEFLSSNDKSTDGRQKNDDRGDFGGSQASEQMGFSSIQDDDVPF